MSSTADDWFPKHRLNVDEYYRMAEVGLLAPDARVELIDGEIIDMAPIGSKHAYVVNALNGLLSAAVAARAVVAVQQPIRLGSRSEPQPDVSLLQLPAKRYLNAHPIPADVLLVAEVSESSLRYDREIKLPLYARHGIPEFWLVDVSSKTLQCLREPRGESYGSIATYRQGSIQLAALPDVAVEISNMLNF